MKPVVMNMGVAWKLTIVLMLAATLAFGLLSGCSDRVTGTQTTNKKPVVYFVNVPPDGATTSRNPLVYWVGLDEDGQVRSFRYVVVLQSDMGGKTAEQYVQQDLPSLPKAKWTYLYVNDTTPDPATSRVVRMSANLTDPVNTYMSQYVFLQAFDDKGLGSDIVFKQFQRNDNPPNTYLRMTNGSWDDPFIDADQPGGAVTGIRVTWSGDDKLDYPTDQPPMQYQWKLFGPYTYRSAADTVSGLELGKLWRKYVKKVFVTTDGHVYRFGNHDTLFFTRDSLDKVGDSVVTYIYDTLVIDKITASNSYGKVDSLFLAEDSTFQADNDPDTGLYRPVDSSWNGVDGWVGNLGDTIFNVYRNRRPAGTVQQMFVLWVRCRDDADVPDQTPVFTPIAVIKPAYERDVLVIDFGKVITRFNAPWYGPAAQPPYIPGYAWYSDTAFNYWKAALERWKPDITFDTIDYYVANRTGDNIPLDRLLAHKIIILYNDEVSRSDFIGDAGPSPIAYKVYKSIDAGVNVWLTMRAPGSQATKTNGPPKSLRSVEVPDVQFQRYFGVTSLQHSGWLFMCLFSGFPSMRIEDFVGAYSLDRAQWPDLTIDTAQLHRRYRWGGQTRDPSYPPFLAWMDSLASLPEVGWEGRGFGTTAMYLYKSRYGAAHPLGVYSSFEGSPVAIRYGTSMFRTAAFMFTPLAIQDDQMQQVTNNILNWLYERYATPATISRADRYLDAAVRISPQEVERNALQRSEEYLRLHPNLGARVLH